MHRLVQTESHSARYFAGIFYMVNPFTYERWMAGQYLVVAGYALLPWLVRALLTFCTQPRKRTAVPVALWYTAIGLLSIHNLVLGAILGVILFAVHLLAQSPKGDYYRAMWRSAGWIVVGVLLLNCYWLYGVLRGSSPIAQTIDGFSGRDLSAFTTASAPHVGLFFNVVSLYGFWLERFHRYAMPNGNHLVWFSGFALVAVLIVFGVRQQRKAHSLLAISLGIAGVIGLVVALGVQAPLSGPIVRWLITHVPLMKGFREPEKFSALLVLGYAYFGGHGLAFVLSKISAKAEGTREILRDAALLLPAFYTATMPFGFANQLKPVSYPASWYSFNQKLQRQPPTGKVLFLPWHEYMSYDFTPRIIANPAPNFFAASVIAGTNAQFGGVDDPTPTLTSRFITSQFLAHTGQTNLGATLAKIHVQYVILAAGYDVNKYAFLQHQTDLQQLSNQAGLRVFVNQAYHG